MKNKFLIIVDPTLAINKQALKVYLVENKLDSIRAAFTDCDASTTFIDRESDALSALTEGMLVAPCLTHAILINAPTIFDDNNDVAVLAVDYRSPVALPEFIAKPNILTTKSLNRSFRILNSTETKVDMTNMAWLYALVYTNGPYEMVADSVQYAYEDVMTEKPFYSARGGFGRLQGVYYRLLTTKKDYDDIASDNQPFVRIF